MADLRLAENTWIDNHTRVRCRAQPLPAVATEHPRRSAINSLTSPNPLQPSAEPWQFTGSAIEWRFLADSYARLGPARVRRARPYFWHSVSSPAVCNGRWSSTDSIDGLSAELDLHEGLFVPSSLTLTMHRQLETDWLLLDARITIGREGTGTAACAHLRAARPVR